MLLILDHPLAVGFDILAGKFNVTIPKNTPAGKNYQFVRKSQYHTTPE
jgi:hypothetical protein